MDNRKKIVLMIFSFALISTYSAYQYFQHVPPMKKIDRVILATDANPNYIQFWPIVAQAWKKIIGVKPTLALIASADVTVDESLGDVIRFEPIPNIPTSLQAQVIRLLLPAYFEDDVCIISDIDMIPLNKDYYIKNIADIPRDHFVVYCNFAYPLGCKLYPMCYNVAKGSTYKEIFNVTALSDIPKIIKTWHSYNLGWGTDETLLYKYLHKWKKFDTHCILLGSKGYIRPQQRVDRIRWGYNQQLLAKRYYIDMHCPRESDSIDPKKYERAQKHINSILHYVYSHYTNNEIQNV